jgi:hypothetical protein
MSLLPQFSFDAVVQAEQGRHDKITLWIDHGVAHGTPNDIQLFKRTLGLGSIFNRPGTNPKSWMQIRRASRLVAGLRVPPPLFSGEYPFNFEGYDSASWQSARTKLRLNLNPTRFLRHQSPSQYIPPRRDFTTTTATFFEAGITPDNDEFARDNEDNWIPDLPAFENLSHPAFGNRIIKDYIEGVLREIDLQTEQAADSVPWHGGDFLPFSFQQDLSDRRFNVRYVETYFEFAVPSTTPHVVSSLEPLLRSYNELGLTGRDWRFAGQQPWDGNSRAVTVKIRTGLLLRVYSKTNKRVRFEVVHDLTKASFPTATETRHTSPTLDGVYDILHRVRTDAADIVNSIFRHMRNQASLPAASKTAVDLLIDITMALGNAENVRTLVSILVDKGSITSQPELKSDLQKLRRAGILRAQEQNRRREHVVTEQYKYPLQMLQQHSFYTVRHRTRTPLPMVRQRTRTPSPSQ